MIRVHVAYPRTEGSRFDADYYVNNHMKLVAEQWPQVVRWEVDLGNDDSSIYGAAHIYFNSIEDFGAATGGPGGPAVMADVANYTDVQPTLAIYNVVATS